ncbi:MAG: hypothetical protein SO016_00625 [Lachnospiraceae bacterium]|nr:zinc-ribbon domain-containing protein [Robinsoniella sp.]MDY3765191.1 hypothetical protein [Lachnospiraceae bacterium]
MERIKDGFRRFMAGRYGADELSRFSMILLLILIVLSIFIRNAGLDSLILGLLIISYFRMFSRNTQKRYQENQKYLSIKNRIVGKIKKEQYIMGQRKEYHIYTCPNCKQKIRIPKGKGKLSIRCPKCGTEFVKNTGRKKKEK